MNMIHSQFVAVNLIDNCFFLFLLSRVSYRSQMPKEFGIIIAGQTLFYIIICLLSFPFTFYLVLKGRMENAMQCVPILTS